MSAPRPSLQRLQQLMDELRAEAQAQGLGAEFDELVEQRKAAGAWPFE